MDIIQKLNNAADLQDEPTPGQPLVELYGQNRVVIEHHGGVVGYAKDLISIRVKYGRIRVCGAELSLTRMTREQLIISGKIDCIQLERKVQ